MGRVTHREFLKRVEGRPFEVLGMFVNTYTRILLRCSYCGHEWLAFPNNIFKGRGCRSCGYINSAASNMKKNRVIEDLGDGAVRIDISTPKHPDATSVMDRNDFDAIRQRISKGTHGYPYYVSFHKHFLIHRLITPNWQGVDHVNGDKTDNRRCNLRECTRQQNAWNHRLHSNNPSGYTGVQPTESGKWHAFIDFLGKRTNLGTHENIADAIAARHRAEVEQRGEFISDRRIG